jgi:ElaB/YqjD/DUF883 family membrane-anchored ribosome-binding protein
MKNAELVTDRPAADLKRLVRHLEDLLQSTAATVGDKAHEIREGLNEALKEAKDICRKLEDETLKGARAANKTIREHPYQSLSLFRDRPAYRRSDNAEMIRTSAIRFNQRTEVC